MDASSRSFRIPYQNGSKEIDACVTYNDTETASKTGIILTHGAGGDMNLPQLTMLSEYLAGHGFIVFRFTCKGLNLVYRIKVFTEVLNYLMSEYPHIQKWILGGLSMGARAAVGLTNNLKRTDIEGSILGTICLSYPLHTKGDHINLRDAPLLELTSPVIFISGTGDDMCKRELMIETLKSVKDCECVWIQNGNHILKVCGETENEVVQNIAVSINIWYQKQLMKVRNDRAATTSTAVKRATSGKTNNVRDSAPKSKKPRRN